MDGDGGGEGRVMNKQSGKVSACELDVCMLIIFRLRRVFTIIRKARQAQGRICICR